MVEPGSDREQILPVFGLGSVLVPGLVMPLHIFEPRYRELVRDLAELPEDRREFAIVAIKDGHEVGGDAVRALYPVGTVAQVREITALPDGRFDIVTVGTRRVRIQRTMSDRSYLQASVIDVPEYPGVDAELLSMQVRAAFSRYRSLFAGGGSPESSLEDDDPLSDDLPDDPGVLSYLVAAAMVLDLDDRQALLESPDDGARLRVELARLREEYAVMRVLPSLPAVDLRSTSVSPN